MFELLLTWMQESFQFSIPKVFEYTSTRAILASITSLAIALFLGPWLIKKLFELKIGQPIRDDAGFLLGELHKNKKDTPTMGGLLILGSIAVSALLWMDLTALFTWLLIGTMVVLGFVGGYDDYLKLRYKNYKGLSGKKKLLVQILWALFVAISLEFPEIYHSIGWLKLPLIKEANKFYVSLPSFYERIYMPFFKEPILMLSGLGVVLAMFFMMFVIVGSSNAVNLTDGLDGLASGLVVMVASCLGIFAFLSNNQEIAAYLNLPYIETSGEIAIFLGAMSGAVLGFLWFNCFPAQVFMGDIGSLSLGGLLGVSAVLLNRSFLLGIAGGIFVFEALSVILQVLSFRYRNKKRIFLCTPIHHHFEYKGWPENKVVIRFWIIGFLLSLIGLASIKFQ